MTDLQKDARELMRLARCMMDSADWLALGEDYCDTAEKQTEINSFANDMANILVDVFNRTEDAAARASALMPVQLPQGCYQKDSCTSYPSECSWCINCTGNGDCPDMYRSS